MKDPHLQFGLTPRRLPGSQLSTNADVVSRLLMIRVEKKEEHSIDERQVPMKKYMALVAQETLVLWDRASLPTRAYSLPSHAGRCHESAGKKGECKEVTEGQTRKGTHLDRRL